MPKGSCKSSARLWTRPRYVSPHCDDLTTLNGLQVADAVKRYSYLLGQTELFKHFVDIKVRSPIFGVIVISYCAIEND